MINMNKDQHKTHSNKATILIVDDESTNLEILSNILVDKYVTVEASSGMQALEILDREEKPDLILLDIMMPEIDGHETCRRIKSKADTKDIDIIFITALDTTESIIAAYEAGAIDYVVKPADPDHLLKKVDLAINNQKQRVELENERKIITDAATNALSMTSEQGVVLDFMRKSYEQINLGDLSRSLVDHLSQFKLHSSVLTNSAIREIYVSDQEPISSLEKQFLQKVQSMGRIKIKGSHMIFNAEGLTLLIKNLPEDKITQARFIELITMLAEGAEARIKAFSVEDQLAAMMMNMENSLKDIQSRQKKQTQEGLKIIEDVLEETESAFMSYGMTEDQEELILNIVKNGVGKALKNYEETDQIQDKLKEFIKTLSSFLFYRR